MHSTVFWCLFVILLAFLALLHNQNTVEYIAGKAFLFISFNKEGLVRFSVIYCLQISVIYFSYKVCTIFNGRL